MRGGKPCCCVRDQIELFVAEKPSFSGEDKYLGILLSNASCLTCTAQAEIKYIDKLEQTLEYRHLCRGTGTKLTRVCYVVWIHNPKLNGMPPPHTPPAGYPPPKPPSPSSPSAPSPPPNPANNNLLCISLPSSSPLTPSLITSCAALAAAVALAAMASLSSSLRW
jgi:hypothetical protein